MKLNRSRSGRFLLCLALIPWLTGCDMGPDTGENKRRGFDFGFEFEFVERERTGLWEHSEGSALLRIVPDGIFSLLLEDEVGQRQLLLGKVTEIEGEIRFMYDASHPDCVGVVGKYTMDLEPDEDGGQTLRLGVKDDSCESRREVLSGTWIKREGSRRNGRNRETQTPDYVNAE